MSIFGRLAPKEMLPAVTVSEETVKDVGDKILVIIGLAPKAPVPELLNNISPTARSFVFPIVRFTVFV